MIGTFPCVVALGVIGVNGFILGNGVLGISSSAISSGRVPDKPGNGNVEVVRAFVIRISVNNVGPNRCLKSAVLWCNAN